MLNDIQFDNHDERIRYYELLLERNLEQIPRFELPKGFRFTFYKKGDRDAWIDIEKSAKEFVSYEQGLQSWNKYYETRQEELPVRMVFIENSEGEKIATATALYDIYGKDKSGDGWQIVKTLTNHPALCDFENVTLDRILDKGKKGI